MIIKTSISLRPNKLQGIISELSVELSVHYCTHCKNSFSNLGPRGLQIGEKQKWARKTSISGPAPNPGSETAPPVLQNGVRPAPFQGEGGSQQGFWIWNRYFSCLFLFFSKWSTQSSRHVPKWRNCFYCVQHVLLYHQVEDTYWFWFNSDNFKGGLMVKNLLFGVFFAKIIQFLRFNSHAIIFFWVQHPFLRLSFPTASLNATGIFLEK